MEKKVYSEDEKNEIREKFYKRVEENKLKKEDEYKTIESRTANQLNLEDKSNIFLLAILFISLGFLIFVYIDNKNYIEKIKQNNEQLVEKEKVLKKTENKITDTNNEFRDEQSAEVSEINNTQGIFSSTKECAQLAEIGVNAYKSKVDGHSLTKVTDAINYILIDNKQKRDIANGVVISIYGDSSIKSSSEAYERVLSVCMN